SRRRHTRFSRDWSSDVCSSDLGHDARYAPSTAQFTQTVKERQSYIDMRNAPRLPAPEAQKDSSPRVSGEKLQALTEVLHGRKSRSEERRVGKGWGARGARAHDR